MNATLSDGVARPSARLDLVHAPTLNFAMEQAGVPIITSGRLTNTGTSTLEATELIVRLDPDLVSSTAHSLGRIRPGESVDLSGIDIRLPAGRLRGLREAERAQLVWEARSGADVVVKGEGVIDVLAHNEWAGLRAPPALLASFVTPNEPVIASVLRRVRDRLFGTTGDNALTGYQLRSEAKVIEMVRSLYETIQSLGVSYVGVAASFEDSGQKIRFAETVLQDGLANCLDLSVLVASCLEQMGLAPLIVVVKGHAFPAVWLIDERFHEGVVYDGARVRNAIALGHLLSFDSSTIVNVPPARFEAAQRVATATLAKDTEFVCAIDIRVARRDRYRPLPLRDAKLEERSRSSMSPEVEAILGEVARDEAEPAVPLASAPTSPEPANGAPAGLNSRFRQWRDKLLDLSLRNRLLHFRDDTKGSLKLEIPDVAKLEDLLAADHVFEIHPKPIDARDTRDTELTRSRGGDELRSDGLARDLENRILHSPFDESRMVKHAVHLDREARAALEEGGSNVLYIAIGFLKWYESDSSPNARLAPLLLVPAKLEYIRTTRRVRVSRVQEDSVPNFTLVEKMKTDFGVDLTSLTTVENDESGLDVPAMLHGVRVAIQRMARWEVVEEAHLGLFSFTKYLMWRDLVDNADVLLQNDVVRHIAEKRPENFPIKGDAVAPERLDDDVPPAQLPLVVDADSTQTAAIVAALRGRSFVLQGPPGTGKSQTITNLIAAALSYGKTVLFVSEKMAALDVVHRRLQTAGLSDFCLELHSHKSQKKEVAQSLGKTLERAERTRAGAWDDSSRAVAGMRGRLNEYVRALHAPTALGKTFHEASARLIALTKAPVIRVDTQNVAALTRHGLEGALVAARTFASVASQVEPVGSHPFRASGVEGWTAQRDHETKEALTDALSSLDDLVTSVREVGGAMKVQARLSLAHATELAELTAAVAAGPVPRAWRNDEDWAALRRRLDAWTNARDDQFRRRTELARRWSEGLYELDLVDLEAVFARFSTAFFLIAWLFLFGARRRLSTIASGTLPGNRQIAQDLGVARKSKEAEEELVEHQRGVRPSVDGCGDVDAPEQVTALVCRGDVLRAASRGAAAHRLWSIDDVATLAEGMTPDARLSLAKAASRTVDALRRYREATKRVLELLVMPEGTWPSDGANHFDEAGSQLRGWLDKFPMYRPWCLYTRERRLTMDAGYGGIVQAHTTGTIRADQCERALERALLTGWTLATRDSISVLRDFDGKGHHGLVEQFREADKKHIGNARAHVVASVEQRLPQVGQDASAASEPGILRREVAKKRGHIPVRKLLNQIPNLLLRLKPCLLMSPLSVAQYLPARARKFDLVVFDEASQICTHDAIGAIGRGEQIVVVGDSKQLPPTAFFQRASEEAPVDDNDFTELESILDEALASGLPEQMLGWHYRSRHEDLISFSNGRYYESKLNVFPAARGRVAELGVKFHHVVGGVYESGTSRQNPVEADALVACLVEMLRATRPEDRSFGVVTFSSTQQELVQNLLDKARAKYPEIERHFADDHPNKEKVFVKNLENVQGDERDEVLFTIGYGPVDATGKMLMNFGPLNRDGGERRLNVAVTRARKQLRLFSSFTADKIDTNRTNARGAKDLKLFLQFAAERDASSMSRSQESSGDFDSDFERDVYDVLRDVGHRVDTQVGCGAYRIDMAVVRPKEPGVYALGIECDGAAYHSGATARDRDRLRQEVLEGLGWKLHRIWSTDWIYDRAREIERLLDAVERASCEPAPPRAVSESSRAVSPAPPEVPVPTPAATPQPKREEAPAGAREPGVRSGPSEDRAPRPYRRAVLPVRSSDPESLYEASSRAAVEAAVAAVLDAEAPIHFDELSRRVGAAFGAARTTTRLRRRVSELVAGFLHYRVIDEFVWPTAVDRASLAVLRAGEREAELVPCEEIAAAASWVLSSAMSLPMGDLVRQTAGVFEISRVGTKVDARMREGIDLLFVNGRASLDGDRVTWRG